MLHVQWVLAVKGAYKEEDYEILRETREHSLHV